uniref:Uncharacterized protein n=1 Tax=Theropithecus gelada TaxID=9565 RepID=A0A8D2K9C9_THEGE
MAQEFCAPSNPIIILQAKVFDTEQTVKLTDIPTRQLNRTKKHAHLTDAEIMTSGDETNLMFILQSKEAVHNKLLESQKIEEEKKIKEPKQKKSYLEQNVKEAEGNIWEMLMAQNAQLGASGGSSSSCPSYSWQGQRGLCRETLSLLP